MRPDIHHERFARSARRALESRAARRWYQDHRSDKDVARRLEAIGRYREELAGADRNRSRWGRGTRLVAGVALSAVAAGILLAIPWLLRSAEPGPTTLPAGAEATPIARVADPMARPDPTYAQTDPAICSSLELTFANASGARTLALAVVGTQPASSTAPWQSTVALSMIPDAIMIELPTAGASVLASIPCDHTLPGIAGYLQTIELDPAASNGLSFAGALHLFIVGC